MTASGSCISFLRVIFKSIGPPRPHEGSSALVALERNNLISAASTQVPKADKPLVASLLLVVRPGAPSSLLLLSAGDLTEFAQHDDAHRMHDEDLGKC